MFGILNLGHSDLPFDSFDLEALDRRAQGGESFDFAQDREPVERLVEPFEICFLVLGVFSALTRNPQPVTSDEYPVTSDHRNPQLDT